MFEEHHFKELIRGIYKMVDKIADLNAAVLALATEIQLAVAALTAANQADDTVAVEAAVTQINNATAALTAAVSPPVTPAV